MMMQNCTLHLDQEQKTWLDLFMCVCVEYCSTWAAQPCVGVGQWHGRHYSRAPRGQCFGWGGWRENFFGGEQAEIWDSCRAWARVRIQPDRFLHGHQPSYLTGSVRVIESSIANMLRSDILVMLFWYFSNVDLCFTQIMKASLFAEDDECDLFQEHGSSKLILDVASPKVLLSGPGRPSSMPLIH